MTGWRESASCAGTDPKVFYPRSMQAGGAEDVKLGKALCAACPVQDECLEEAVELGDVWGWRAGKSPNEIKAMVVDRHGSAPLQGFGADWHPKDDSPQAWEAKERRAEASRETARRAYERFMGREPALDREDPAVAFPEQRQPEADVAEVA